MRYELKILFLQSEKDMILNNLMCSSFMVQEIFSSRQVNNIYFDTLGYSDYRASINGADFRKKYRIRWYGDLFGENQSPTLELKYKRGWEGGKIFLLVPQFSLEGFDNFQYYANFREEYSKYTPEEQVMLGELLSRNPVLVNTYQRRYFQTVDEKIRITLDEKMSFYDMQLCCGITNALPTSVDPNILLELKFDVEDYKVAQSFLQQLGYRIYKNSKYVNGINSVLYHIHPR